MRAVSRFFVPAPEDVNPELGLPTRTMVVSHLPFQMLMYYNRIYFCIWIVLFYVSAIWKRVRITSHLENNDHWTSGDFWTLIWFHFAALLDICRLYLGYSGNLREQGFEMLAFWMLALLQPCFGVYFIVGQFLAIPMDMAIHILKLFFDVTGIVLGWFAMKRMIKFETSKFHLNQFVTNPTAARNPLSPKLD